jgi:hypothetical protein
LFRSGAHIDSCGRCLSIQPCLDQAIRNDAGIGDAHVDDQRRVRVGKASPVQFGLIAVLGVPGDKPYAMGMIAVGERNASVGGASSR